MWSGIMTNYLPDIHSQIRRISGSKVLPGQLAVFARKWPTQILMCNMAPDFWRHDEVLSALTTKKIDKDTNQVNSDHPRWASFRSPPRRTLATRPLTLMEGRCLFYVCNYYIINSFSESGLGMMIGWIVFPLTYLHNCLHT